MNQFGLGSAGIRNRYDLLIRPLPQAIGDPLALPQGIRSEAEEHF